MLDYVVSLAKKHTDEIGFLPKATVEHYVRAGQVLLETEDGDPCGFLIFGNGWPRLKIYQACIQYDAQRRAHGLALVGRVIALASERGCDAVSLWCADDLPANEFWRAAGFQLLRSKPGGRRRERNLNLWVYWLPTNLLPGFCTLRDSENGAGRAEENRRRSPVSIQAASPKAALHAFTAEGGGSFAAPTGHALSLVNRWATGRRLSALRRRGYCLIMIASKFLLSP